MDVWDSSPFTAPFWSHISGSSQIPDVSEASLKDFSAPWWQVCCPCPTQGVGDGGRWDEVYSFGPLLFSLWTLVSFPWRLCSEGRLCLDREMLVWLPQQPTFLLISLSVGCLSVYPVRSSGSRWVAWSFERQKADVPRTFIAMGSSHVYVVIIDVAPRWHVLQGIQDTGSSGWNCHQHFIVPCQLPAWESANPLREANPCPLAWCRRALCSAWELIPVLIAPMVPTSPQDHGADLLCRREIEEEERLDHRLKWFL